MARCSTCSAPLPPHGTVCDYCGSRNNVDLRGIHEYTVSTPESDRICPLCKVKMQTIDIQSDGTFLIEQCRECYGLFFDPGELEALLESSVTNVFAIDYQRLAQATRGRHLEEIRYQNCPVCGTLMNRINFGSRSGVIVDRCKGHGVWLDGGELRRLLEWKKAGGQLLHQKVKAERKEEERKREEERGAARQVLAREAQDGSIWESGSGGGLDLPDLLIGLAERLFR